MAIRDVSIPLSPGVTVERPIEGDDMLDQNDQRDFRSDVGILLYLVKLSRPDLSNAVRELSKVMDGATEVHMNMLHRLVRFVLETRDRGILVKPRADKGVYAYVDIDFAGNKDDRRSIT
jgi:hypothetical protein